MDVFGNWTIWTVVDAKFHGLPLTQRRGTLVDGGLVHLQVYSMFAGDSSNSVILIKCVNVPRMVAMPFPKFETEIDLA